MSYYPTRLLSELENGSSGVITRVAGHGAFRKRITEMGFVRGKVVKVIKNAPLQDPIEYEIMGYRVSLRRSEAQLIQVIPEELFRTSFQKTDPTISWDEYSDAPANRRAFKGKFHRHKFVRWQRNEARCQENEYFQENWNEGAGREGRKSH